MYKYEKRPEKNCPICDSIFMPKGGKQNCCSRACARKLEWKTRERQLRIKHTSGYIKYYVGHDHPYADKHGYIMEHRYMMEQQLGRLLNLRERVHHKNGIRSDNRIENLELWTLDHKDPSGIRVSDLHKDSSWVVGLLYI